MSNSLSAVKTDASVEEDKDSLGASSPLESAIYDLTCTMAYIQKSQGGALGVVCHFDVAGQSRDLRETFWVASGDAKGNQNYYQTKAGEKRYLPGFTNFRALCLLTSGVEPDQMQSEERVVAVYNPESKKEEPTKVEMITALIGEEIIAGVIQQMVDKNVKSDSGEYVASGETRMENTIDKFFRKGDRFTVPEILGGATSADFHTKWEEKNTGQVRDRTTKSGAGTAGQSTSPGFGQKTNKPTESLFKKPEQQG